MSADGQGDSGNLNKEEISSANDAIAVTTIISQDGSSTLPKADCEEITPYGNASSASKLELQAPVDVERTEQKPKPAEKEKALDIDSELDFELKWDDDNEMNPDNQSQIDTDLMSSNETHETSNKLIKEQETMAKPCITELQIEDTTIYEEVASAKDDSTGELLNIADKETHGTEDADEDTNLNIHLKSKVVESDPNSLDEHLVYSDVETPELEAPEEEEKDVLDELYAHISDNNLILPKTEGNTKECSLQNDLVSNVNDDLKLLPVQKDEIPDADDTLSSNTEVETSTYEVNNEHGLANPDVMIEIPTQDFIEDFDDSELSEDGEQYDEDMLLNNDTIDIQEMVTDSKDMSPRRHRDPISVEKPVSDESDKSEDTSSDKIEEKSQSIVTAESHADIIIEATCSGTITTTADDVLLTTEPKTDKNYDVQSTDELKLTITNVPPTTEPKLNTNNDEQPTEQLTSDDDVHPTVDPKSIANDDVKSTLEPKPTTNIDLLATAEPTTTDAVQAIAEPKQTTSNDVQPTDKPKTDSNLLLPGETEVEESSLETIEVTKDADDSCVELGPNTEETEVICPSAKLRVSSTILELPEAFDSSKDLEKTQITETEEGSTSCNLETKETANGEDVASSQLLEPKKVAEAEVLSTTADLKPKQDLVKSDSAVEAQASTSKYLLREYSEVSEVTDSLGLLAESSAVIDDDEDEQEREDDDDDFDQDDESNLMTAESSEDSNPQQSEIDVSPSMDVEESPATDKDEFTFPTEVDDAVTVAEAQDDIVAEGIVADENELAIEALLRSETPEDEEPTKDVSPENVSDDDEQMPEVQPETDRESRLRQLLLKYKNETTTPEEKKSPSKVTKLEITKTNTEINFVDLEESSSEDDIEEVDKQAESETEGMTSVNIPDEVEVMAASAGSMSAMRHGDGEVVISGVPKPPPQKPARLNTSEVSIKTTQVATDNKALPDSEDPSQDSSAAPKYGLEVFSLDSDDEDKPDPPKKMTAVELDRVRQNKQCVNMYCTSDSTTPLLPCDTRCAAYYGVKRGKVCEICLLTVAERTQGLIEGMKSFAPLLSLDMGQKREEFVEISDSDSEDEPDVTKAAGGVLGKAGAMLLEEKLADMFNMTWEKFNMEDRLLEAQDEIWSLVLKMEGEIKDVDAMLSQGQQKVDKARQQLYSAFARRRQELPAILIYDTVAHAWSGLEDGVLSYESSKESRQNKRRLAAATEPPAKKLAIPLGYTPLDSDADTAQNQPKTATPEAPVQNDDDSGDISVVRLSAEAAPAGLPPPGAPARAPLRAGAAVYAIRNAYGTWHKAKIVEVHPKGNNSFTTCKVKFEHRVKNPCKLLPARCLAYDKPADVRMTIGTRVIALFKDPNSSKTESFYSGIIAEIPTPVNNYRYLVFFDDGYAQYVSHNATRLVCEFAKLVWDEVHPFSRQFVRDYLVAYPERPMVRVHAGQSLKTEWNGKWWVSRVVKVDASLVQVHFQEDDRYEWIYRGSTRLAPLYLELQAAERQRARPLPRAQPGRRSDMPYVEYTRSDEPAAVPASTPQQMELEIRRQRAVAKKSTALPPARAAPAHDPVTSRVVHYTPKNSVRPKKMVTHKCGPLCRRTGSPTLKDLRTYNPLAKPLLSGWDRQTAKYRLTKAALYVAPCGRRLRGLRELHRYLLLVASDLAVDLFDFAPFTNCLAEFVLNRCYNSKKDLSNGKERVPVPCVNYYDDSLPEFCLYSTQREPTTGVPLNLDPEFLCGCDCTDDCADKSKCACWKLTLEGARTIGFDSDDVGYKYKRLPEPLPSGIYECNSRCNCKQTCLNRVAQHPLQLKLQVFKTQNRGWGIRALNEVPRGGFICVYAGNLLTDATANLDGLIEGDEYLAELDYIEVVEQMKEGFEEEARAAETGLEKDDNGETEFTESSSGEETEPRDRDNDDDDFQPAEDVVPASMPEYSNRLRKRDRKDGEDKDKKENSDENCITISDDEELREPSRFAAQTGMGAAGFVSKYKSVRAHFGEDEACYIMDAKVQGNIGRYLNHSCTPNVFVQNVFVDTHDPRFPWVAFFALAHISAGTELTWNYNYDVGSVPGKVLYCHCGEPNCRGRLL